MQKRPYVEILEQPAANGVRFRYKNEKQSSVIYGASSTHDKKTFPSFRLLNYTGHAVAIISCVSKDTPYRPHPTAIVGKPHCNKGICRIDFLTRKSDPTKVSLKNIGLQCCKKADAEKILTEREILRVDPYRTGYNHKTNAVYDASCVRLCLQIFLKSDDSSKVITVPPVVSNPITDSRYASELRICDISDVTSSTSGGKKIILLCNRVTKNNIKIRFYQNGKDDSLKWEAWADFRPTNVHNHVAISFKTPPYVTNDITEPVTVMMQLVRTTDGHQSEPRLFYYLPDYSNEEYIRKAKKRKIIENLSFFESARGVDFAEEKGNCGNDELNIKHQKTGIQGMQDGASRNQTTPLYVDQPKDGRPALCTQNYQTLFEDGVKINNKSQFVPLNTNQQPKMRPTELEQRQPCLASPPCCDPHVYLNDVSENPLFTINTYAQAPPRNCNGNDDIDTFLRAMLNIREYFVKTFSVSVLYTTNRRSTFLVRKLLSSRMLIMFIQAKYKLLIVIAVILNAYDCANIEEHPLRISLTISSKFHHLEISWFNLKPIEGVILITNEEPTGPYHKLTFAEDQYYATTTEKEDGNATSTVRYDQMYQDSMEMFELRAQDKNIVWTYGVANKSAKYWLQPTEKYGWITTNIPFNMEMYKNVSIHTKCYGYWAVYLNSYDEVKATACISAYPTWMNDMKDHIGRFKFRDLFLAGTHDSGSYRERFDPMKNETLVTKYALTQDDDIYGQLMHGVRYLDIRIGYYRASQPVFWVNHGITRQQSLTNVLQQVKDFVLETNEIVIFDVQEWPVGFSKKLEIHRSLVHFIQNEIGDLLVDPNLTWDSTLNEIWKTKRNIILGYDMLPVVHEFPSYLWHSVQQRWGNVQSLADLKRYLSPTRNFVLFTSRPVADMAELTPNTWDVLTDRFGGLRRMADQTNRHICRWYIEEWGSMTNIVAVDFVRGTNLVETSLYWNRKKNVISG
ncbi:Embryonic polarity protein dorsal, partial [Pseudolycoriella hygida]